MTRSSLVRHLHILAQEVFGVLASLTEADIAIGEEGAALLNDLEFGGEIEDIADSGDAFVEHDVELGGAEGGRDLVLDDLDAGAIADDFVADLDGLDAAHIEPDGSIEFERITAGGGFRVAEHDADLRAQLVGEDDRGLGLVDGAGKFAKRLRHEAGLHTHGGIAHIAFDFGTGDEGGDRVDHDDIHAAGADEGFGDLKRLFAGIGLRDEQVINIHTDAGGIDRVEGVFHINECRDAA